eukprot:TRINITY_DN72651_c0_g1_i1.p1 TRINITY_DN72651_c0_g1~~TRINITY_DN72651_c0_g1_i1.p1  ORF type:complete len:1576 (-),score=194.02 TRINITY_DN72651_c0_g1_i1:79-4761(-)
MVFETRYSLTVVLACLVLKGLQHSAMAYCMDSVWHPAFGCHDNTSFVDAQGNKCPKWFFRDCFKAEATYGFTQEEQTDILRNCPQSCTLACTACGDSQVFLDEMNLTCVNHSQCLSPSGSTKSYSAAGQSAVLRYCPKACGLCTCRNGICFHPQDPEDAKTLQATKSFRAVNRTVLRLVQAGWLSVGLVNRMVAIIAYEILGHPFKFLPVIPSDVENALLSNAIDISMEEWSVAKQVKQGIGQEGGVRGVYSSAGYSGSSSLWFAGVRFRDCPQGKVACEPCTTADISAGRCAEISDSLNYWSSYLSNQSRVLKHFPAPGEGAPFGNMTYVYFWNEDTTGMVNVTWQKSVNDMAFNNEFPRFVPPHCTSANARCIEIYVQPRPRIDIMRWILTSRFPAHLVHVSPGYLNWVLARRSQVGNGTVFESYTPEPLPVVFKAQEIIPDSSMIDYCSSAITLSASPYPCDIMSLNHLMRTDLAYKAPELWYMFKKELLTINNENMNAMMDKYSKKVPDSMLVCWYVKHYETVINNERTIGQLGGLKVFPDCLAHGSQAYTASNGETRCCNGTVETEVTSREVLPSICIPRCSTAEIADVSQQKCVPICSPGFHRLDDGSCQACPAGRFQVQVDGPLKPICLACAAGQYSQFNASTQCEVCPAGKISSKESASCTDCPVSTQPSAAGQEYCPCAQGYFHKGGKAYVGESCMRCPDPKQTTEFSGSESNNSCYCAEGFFLKDEACEPCPVGLKCNQGNREPLQASGYNAVPVAGIVREYNVYRCTSIAFCPEGAPGLCVSGRQGIACGQCRDGHYPTGDGSCRPCKPADLSLSVVGGLLAIPFVSSLYLVATSDAAKQSLSTMALTAAGSQLADAVQFLGMMKALSMNFLDPLQSLLATFAVLGFDLNIFRVSCALGNDDRGMMYFLRLCMHPALVVFLATIMLIQKARKGKASVDSFINANGLMVQFFFTGLLLAIFVPFNCIPHPNGTSSLLASPSILCWTEDGAHTAMAFIASLAILAYPVFWCSLVVVCALLYPRKLTSRSGMVFLERFRWLFGRFSPEAYYFGAVLFIIKCMVGLIPVVFTANPSAQVLAMSIALVLLTCVQCYAWPWRAKVANLTHAGVNVSLVMFLLASSLLTYRSPWYDEKRAERTLQMFFVVAVAFIPVLVLGLVVFGLYKKIKRGKRFGAFLCHHKAGAGILARYFERRLMHICKSTDIFIDSDDLVDLTTLFDIVRTQVGTLMILGSKEVFARPWCAGELATSVKNNVPIMLVELDDYQAPDKNFQDTLEHSWPIEQRTVLSGYGLDMPVVCAALDYVCTLPKTRFHRFEQAREQHEELKEIMGKCTTLSEAFASRTSSWAASAAELIVIGNGEDAEALTTCQLLSDMIQEKQQIATTAFHPSEDPSTHLQASHTMVVVLSRGVMTSPSFIYIFMAAYLKGLQLLPVHADSGFAFPMPEFFERLGKHELNIGIEGEINQAELAIAYKELLTNIAVPFSPLSGIALIKRQVEIVCSRISISRDNAEKTLNMTTIARTASLATMSSKSEKPHNKAEDVTSMEEASFTL